MSSGNRRPYLTATVLDQDLLDNSSDNLTNQIELIIDVEAPAYSLSGAAWVKSSSTVVRITATKHGLNYLDKLTLAGSTDATLDGVNQVSLVVDENTIDVLAAVTDASGTVDVDAERTLYISNKNKYVGGIFYQAAVRPPSIKRTIGEWLSPTIQFANVTLSINNVNGELNKFLPAGENFSSFLQNRVIVKIGLREVSSSYKTIFIGRVTEVEGVQRNVLSLDIVCRDDLDKINQDFPPDVFEDITYPNISDTHFGKIIPVIYGRWNTNLNPSSGASIPCIPVNSLDADVSDPDVLPTPFTTNVEMVISQNSNISFDSTTVTLVRSDVPTVFNSADIVNVSVNNNSFEIKNENSGGVTLLPDGNPYSFKEGDKIFCHVEGKDLGAYTDNIVWQARDILITYGGVSPSDFHANWATFRDKAAPAESATANILSRLYRDKTVKAMTYALSLLEQVRLEAFVSNDQLLKLNSTQFDEMTPVPGFVLRNWDFEKNSFNPKIDARNNFNRTKGLYNLLPDTNNELNETKFLRNSLSITLANDKVIDKGIAFPNLYVDTDVINQSTEILKLASSYFEIVTCSVSWRSLLLDLGDFVMIDIKIGSVVFNSVPAMIREIGYASNGKINLKLWSFQMTPFPGYNPGYVGIVGGYNAVITEG